MVPITDLDAHLATALRRASNAIDQRLAKALAPHGVTVAEWAVLRTLLATGPTAPSDLAARLMLTRGAISKLVERLSAKALVGRARAGGDGRRMLVTLTGVGRRLVPTLATIADAEDETIAATLQDRAGLEVALRALAGGAKRSGE